MLKKDNISFADMLSSPLWFDLGYRQIKLSSKDNLDNVTSCDVSLEYILMSSGLTNTFGLIQTTYESIFLECVDKFVIEPINVILIISMTDKIRVE